MFLQDRRWHTHQDTNLANQSPCWVVEALPLRRCVSNVLWNIPTEKSWEILSDPVIQAGDSWALGRVGRLLSSGVHSIQEGESLLFMSLGFHLICHNTTPSIGHFWPSKMLCRCQCIRKCSATKDVKQEYWIVGLKEGASLVKAWTEEDAEFHRSDLIGFSQITSNLADRH